MWAEEVTEEEIGQMNAAQIFALAGDMDLDLSGCNDREQFRDRVLLHLRAHKGLHYDLQREFGVKVSEAAESTRHSLDSLLDSVYTALSPLSPTLEHALRTDFCGSGVTVPLMQQIENRRRSLLTSECCVIVAGETNAGKSTFLNLLLGMDVLPTSIFSCTAAVCSLRYAPTFTATLRTLDGRRHSQQFPDAESTKQWLDTRVAEQNLDKRERGLDIHSIHVGLPATVLQSGVTLVDTPGIGENEAMTRCTMDYVKKHSAAAYLYLIKTDNAGGVHEDRLLDFLRAILQYNEENRSADVFNFSAAMFVCNRMDQVPAEQQERVRDNALYKLREVWPQFQARQALFLSSTDAQMHVDSDPRYITGDYEQVLRGLKDMFLQARANAVNQHYRWLKHFLHASTSFLQTAVYHCAMTDDQLILRFKSTRDRLQALERRTTTTTQQLHQHVQQAMQSLCGDIRNILQDQEIREHLLDWNLQSLPFMPAVLVSDEEEADRIIMRRIIDRVDHQIRSSGQDQELHNKLRKLFQEELKLVDEDIDSILSDMKDTTSLSSSTSSYSSCMSTDSDDEDAQELLRLYREQDRFRPRHLKHVKHVSRITHTLSSGSASSQATLAKVPRVLASRLIAGVWGSLARLGRKMQQRKRKSLVTSNPEQYMRERTEKLVKAVCDREDCLLQMAAKYHQMDSFIADLEKSIPTFIARNHQQMEDIKNNRKNYFSQRKELITLMENLEPVRDMLRGFGALYIRDVTADNICFVLDADQRRESVTVKVKDADRKDRVSHDSGIGGFGLDMSRRLSLTSVTSVTSVTGSAGPWTSGTAGSLWSTFRRGHVTIGSNREDVTGRTYIQPPSEHVLIKEIARLRCLRSDCLAPFLGMTHVDDLSVFLFRGDLRSARRFLWRGFNNPSESVPRLLEGLVEGLHYLHREGLVHMELSLDTVMVNADGDPRLCGACLPRRARLPPDADVICAEPFVCLSPEVLRDEVYTAEDDIYSLGLIVWETCLQDKPYRQFRASLTLQQFRSQVHPSSMLGLETFSQVSDGLAAILRGCLLPARGLRLKMEDLKERVSLLRSDAVVLSLSTVHRRAQFHNRPMKRASTDDTPSAAASASE